jgi:hypothetical protein
MSHFHLACHMTDESRLSSDNSIYENANYEIPLCTLPHLPLNKSAGPNFLLSTQPENSVYACMIPLRVGDHVLQKWKIRDIIIQSVPLPTKPGICLIILKPVTILQRDLNRSMFVLWEIKRNVSVVCVCFVAISSLGLELLKKCRVW